MKNAKNEALHKAKMGKRNLTTPDHELAKHIARGTSQKYELSKMGNKEINKVLRKKKEKFNHEPVHGDGRRVKIAGE